LTLKEALLSQKRHRRPYMAPKWMPRAVLLTDTQRMDFVGAKEKDLFLPCIKFGYSVNDVLKDDWEIEDDG
jgi:hypothetical protein